MVRIFKLIMSTLWVFNSLGWRLGLHECLAGLPSSRLSNDLTPTASLPLLVPTPIVSPAERSPTGLGCQGVEFCRRGNVLTWRQLQIEEPCKVIFLSEKRLFLEERDEKKAASHLLTRYFLLTWFSFTNDLISPNIFRSPRSSSRLRVTQGSSRSGSKAQAARLENFWECVENRKKMTWVFPIIMVPQNHQF